MTENFYSTKASLLVAASFGLVAYGAVLWKHSHRLPDEIVTNTISQLEADEPMEPINTLAASNPGAITITDKASSEIDPHVETSGSRIERVIDANLGHVTMSRSIVIFSNGTSVVVQEPSMNPLQDAQTVLMRCQSPEIKFKAHEVEHGRTIVAYEGGAVYHWLFPQDIGLIASKSVGQIQELLTPAEQSQVTEGWNPPLHARLGLAARQWLAQDVADPHVVKILKGSAVVARNTKVGKVLPAVQK